MTDICEKLVRFAGKVCISTDAEVEASIAIEALRAENARLLKALNELVVAVDWEATAIIGGADDVVTRAQILQACARAAMGESDE